MSFMISKSEQQQHFDYAMERIEKAKAKEKDEILDKTLETLLTEVKTMKKKSYIQNLTKFNLKNILLIIFKF